MKTAQEYHGTQNYVSEDRICDWRLLEGDNDTDTARQSRTSRNAGLERAQPLPRVDNLDVVDNLGPKTRTRFTAARFVKSRTDFYYLPTAASINIPVCPSHRVSDYVLAGRHISGWRAWPRIWPNPPCLSGRRNYRDPKSLTASRDRGTRQSDESNTEEDAHTLAGPFPWCALTPGRGPGPGRSQRSIG